MIEVSHLTKQYGDYTAVEDLSFRLERGKVYGFLGPNGAGKSTTMNIMTGYIASTSGRVCIDGHDILEEPEVAKGLVGYLPEIPPLYVDLTVREYLATVAELKHLPRKEREGEVRRVMERLGLAAMKNRLIKNLSKGYKQRVGIAQALLGSPPVIILDEPTVGLDPRQILEIRSLILGLKEEHTVILSSHILSEISAVCDDVLIINHGHLVASGTAQEVEQLLKGRKTLTLLIEGERASAEKALREVEALDTLKIREEGEQLYLSLTAKEEADIRREVSRSLFSHGCVILEMKQEEMSLEEVFLALTKEEGKDAGSLS